MFVWDGVSVDISGWPGTHFVDQVVLEFTAIHLSLLSQFLGLMVYAPSLYLYLLNSHQKYPGTEAIHSEAGTSEPVVGHYAAIICFREMI